MESDITLKRIKPKDIEAAGLPFEYYDDKVCLENYSYKDIFHKSHSQQNSLPWRRGIVKITVLKKGGRKSVIRRLFHSGNILGYKKNEVGLTLASEQILLNGRKKKDIIDIGLARGNRILFVWQHPNHLIRIGFKYALILGTLSVVLGIVSVILALFD